MKKIRIGVLMGGRSLEKEVSFNTGRTVCDHLHSTRYTVVPLYQKNTTLFLLPWHFLHRGKTTDFEYRLETEATSILWSDLKNHVDFIYIAQHGRYAEDGTLQGFLEMLNIPYLGSGILASALRTDKIIQKIFLNAAGICTPRFIAVESYEIDNFEQCEKSIRERLCYAGITDDYVVKPYNEGSSIGISIVQKNNLEIALKKACYVEQGKKKRVLIEEKLEGMEFTCIVLTDNRTGEFFALPPTESVSDKNSNYFCYEQKYMPGRGEKHTPARCNSEITQLIQNSSIAVMHALEFKTIGRIDGFVTKDSTIVITDPNSLCGMAPSSYIFNQAAEINMSPSDIINHIITTELYNYNIVDNEMNYTNSSDNSMIAKKIRVAVLLGGASNEKETSLDSGRNVFYKLNRDIYDPIPLFLNDSLDVYHITQSQLVRNSTKEIATLLQDTQKIIWDELSTIADFVFIALHGGQGEDGTVQGMLEILDIPYNGSSVLASALCMNKYKANQLLAAHGFDVPKNVLIYRNNFSERNHFELSADFIYQAFECGKSLIVKPHDDGCSVMVQKVSTEQELLDAIGVVLQQKDAVLIEEYIVGMELTVGVIGNTYPRALPPSQAVATNGILSIEEKFLPGAGENRTPAPLPEAALSFVKNSVADAFKTAQCKGYARIDCFYQTAEQSPTSKERVVILEINTLPGLTPATCLFHQAAEVGLKPSEFLDLVIQLGFEEHKKESMLMRNDTVFADFISLS